MSNSIISKRRIGSVSKKGETIIRDMIYWNAVNACVPDSCGCASICSFATQQRLPEKCEVVYNYMNSVLDMIIRNYPKEMTEDIAYRIGMHLIPLYKILCRLKMAEFATTEVLFSPSTGNVKVTPLFKEIRDTILLIEKTWKSLGFNVVEPKKVSTLKEVGYFNGKSYYEVIEGGTNVQALEEA